MARLLGLGAVLLGAVAWPAFTQDAPPRTGRGQPVAMPSPSPTPAPTPSIRRIRRLPAIDGQRTVDVRESREQVAPAPTPTPAPLGARPIRERSIPVEAVPVQRQRDPFESEEISTPPETRPVRDRRRIPVEATPTPTPRDTTPVRVRRTPVETVQDAEPAETRPVRTRRVPTEATPPPSEPGPVRVRRTPVEVQEPSGPVRVRRVPVETLPDEPPPVRVRRTPNTNTPVEVPEPNLRIRRIPVEEPPVPRRKPVWAQPEPVNDPSEPLFQAGRCGVRGRNQPIMARYNQNTLQDASLAVITPPSEAAVSSLSNSLTLRAGSYADVMRTLPVLRQIPASALRSNAIMMVGKNKFDFRPMVQNPSALLNIAENLRGIPDQVDVCADVLEAMEIQQGLVVRSLLTYSIRPGGCRDASSRARLARTGVNCFTRASKAERDSAFARPGDPRFVRDPVKRAQAIAASHAQAAKMAADIDQSVADFRSQMNSPAQRAQMVAEAGADEVARLEALTDEDLAGELANSSETRVEQVAFIPNLNTLGKVVKPLSLPAAAPEPEPPVDVEYDIGRYVFLTGFTLGKEYQWKQRVQTTIKWCLVGCKKTYYAEVFASFNYGFGLRIPIEFGGTYNPKPDANGKAQLTVHMKPINGSVADYQSTGLPAGKLYDGKELVAEIGADAGASAKLPIVGVLSTPPLGVHMDFTEGLPGLLANGQFTPPTPGDPSTEPEVVKVFDTFDLIGGRANFGVLGGQLFPAVKVRLHSTAMGLTLNDTTLNGPSGTTILNKDGQPVKLDIYPGDQSTEFTVGDPVYDLSFNVTPGLDARLFIDLAVWGTHWDWPIWFPQLAVDLPPGGASFACHSGTICSHSFRFNPKGSQTVFEGKLEAWAKGFDPKWAPQCSDAICEFGIGLIRQNVLFSGRHKLAANGGKEMPIEVMEGEFYAARKKAQEMVTESLARKAEAASNSWGVIAQGFWTPQCKDSQCYDEVKALAAAMGPRARQIAQTATGQSPTWVSQQVNKEYSPKFQKAIDDSKARHAMEQSLEMQRQANKHQMPKLPKPIK